MAAGFPAFKDKPFASVFQGIFHHGYRWRVKICLGPCLFKFCHLGRNSSCKKCIGNFIFFNHIQVFFYRRIKSFHAHKSCTENIHFLGTILEHIVCQLFRKTSHCEKRQCSLFKDFICKIRVVGDICHRPLDQWKFCSLILGKGRTRLYRIKCINKI